MKIHREAICCKLAQLPFHLLASNWKGLRKCNLSDHVSVSACVDSKPPPNFPKSPEAIILPHVHSAWKMTLTRVKCVHFVRLEKAVSYTPKGGIHDPVRTLPFFRYVFTLPFPDRLKVTAELVPHHKHVVGSDLLLPRLWLHPKISHCRFKTATGRGKTKWGTGWEAVNTKTH